MRQNGIFRNWKFMICDNMEYSGILKFEPKTSYRTCKFMMCDKMEYSEIRIWNATFTPVLRDMEYFRNSKNPRSESNQTHTYRKDTKHPWTASLWLSHCRCTFRADDLSSSTSSSKKKFLLKKFRTDLDKCVSSLSASGIRQKPWYWGELTNIGILFQGN